MRNEMEIIFDAVSDNEGFARVAVAAFITNLNPTLEEMADIKTAVSEAVTNCIIHGYENIYGYRKAVTPDGQAVQNKPAAQNKPETQNGPAAQKEPAAQNKPETQNGPAAQKEPAAQNGQAAQNEPAVHPGKVRVHCVLENEVLHIEVSDTGKGIEDVEQAMEPLFTTKPELERSGMGFAFMEAFMDDLEVESAPGKGTTVRMVKKIGLGSWIA